VLFWNKLLPMFVLPLGWVVGLMLYGILRKRRRPLVIALVLLWVSSMSAIGNSLFRWLESRYPSQAVTEVEPADAIVPLGGIFGPAPLPGRVLNVGEAGERVDAGVALWQAHKAPWLVFTGGRTPWAIQAEVEGAVSARVAIARGVPADKVVVTREVGNTSDEAKAVADLMRERGWKKIILVTSAWHMPRAARQFRKAGIDFIPFPVDYQLTPRQPLTLLDLLPRADGLRTTEMALRELYGIAFYTVIGR
jgi:uncharacterized SAM-binding protein YcdF (DUF218 family)